MNKKEKRTYNRVNKFLKNTKIKGNLELIFIENDSRFGSGRFELRYSENKNFYGSVSMLSCPKSKSEIRYYVMAAIADYTKQTFKVKFPEKF